MKILQLCKKFPYPTKDGESVAIINIASAMKSLGCELHLLAMNTTKHYVEDIEAIRSLDIYSEVHAVEIDNRLHIKDAAIHLLAGESYHIARFKSEEFNDKLIELLRQNDYDVVQMETVYLSHYVDTVKTHSSALISLRAHNIEHEIWDRITHNTSFLPKKWYVGKLTSQLRKYEIEHLNKYDFIAAISNKDLINIKSLGYKNGAIFTPVGVDTASIDFRPKEVLPDRFKIGFIGSLDWMPNLAGVQWLIREVWPALKAAYPHVELHIAGRNTPKSIRQLQGERLHVHGEIEDAAAFVKSCDTMVVPLFSGSGMRVKIIESMTLGCPTVTTSVGLEGINAKHRSHIAIANTKEEFISELSRLVDSPDYRQSLAQNAYHFIQENFDNLKLARELFDQYEQHIAKKQER